MTPDEYFNAHLPHRVNLLTTFRERYSPSRPSNPAQPKQPFDKPRDFFRCSKDVSMMMVRFFCDEMGIFLPRGASDLKERQGWAGRFGIRQFTLTEARADAGKYKSLLIVMKAANRAVAHISDPDVDHPIKLPRDHQVLFETIDWIEELIQTHMYGPNGRALRDAMKLPNNVM